MKILRPALSLFVILSVLTGLVYPMVVTGLAQLFWPHQANGSLISLHGQLTGSSLIGQTFTRPDYFWGRASGTSPTPYNAANSGGFNTGLTNPALKTAVAARIAALKAAGPVPAGPVPVDLVTASASGLDPEISPAAAYYQVERIAARRHLPEQQVTALVKQYVQEPLFGFLGEARVNVLALNMALDQLK